MSLLFQEVLGKVEKTELPKMDWQRLVHKSRVTVNFEL
jgi:hypothetical protein